MISNCPLHQVSAVLQLAAAAAGITAQEACLARLSLSRHHHQHQHASTPLHSSAAHLSTHRHHQHITTHFAAPVRLCARPTPISSAVMAAAAPAPAAVQPPPLSYPHPTAAAPPATAAHVQQPPVNSAPASHKPHNPRCSSTHGRRCIIQHATTASTQAG